MKLSETFQAYFMKLRAKWRPLVFVFSGCLLSAQIGSSIYPDPTVAPSLLWFPIGISIAAVLLEGEEMLVAIALAALVNSLMKGSTPFLISIAVTAAIFQPLIALVFTRKTGFDKDLGTVKDVVVLLVIAFFGTMVQPTIGVAGIILNNYFFGMHQPTIWVTRWLGGLLSTLVLTPLILQFVTAVKEGGGQPFFRTREVTGSLLFLTSLSYLVFATPYVSVGGFSLVYPLIAVLFWIAFSAGVRAMTAGLFLMTVISMVGLLYGTHPPLLPGQSADISTRIFNVEVFDAFICLFFFILTSINSQRRKALVLLREKTDSLEIALQKLQQEDAAKNEFIATLAHELRNPLAPVLSSMELVSMQGVNTVDTPAIIEMAQTNLKIIARLLDDLLDVSRNA